MIRPLDAADRGYVLFSFRESAKKAPGLDRVPWAYFKATTGRDFERVLDDATTRVLGAYDDADQLLGWLVMTPGKRVSAVHWVYTKHKHRREGVMTALLEAAELGPRFVYTHRARRDRSPLPDGTVTKSLDETLVAALRARGVSATHIPMKDYL